MYCIEKGNSGCINGAADGHLVVPDCVRFEMPEG